MITKTPEGYWIIEGDTHIGKWVCEHQRLDHDLGLSRFDAFITPGSTVIDVGANIGSHTCHYLQCVGHNGTVIAYEPHKECFECLIRNCPRAICYNLAAGATSGIQRMVEDPSNVGMSYITSNNLVGSYDVKVVSLDEHVHYTRDNKISFIKIDTQGCDLEVLMGSTKILQKFRPPVFAEWYPDGLHARGYTTEDFRNFLESISYSSCFLSNDNWNSPQGDLLCSPK